MEVGDWWAGQGLVIPAGTEGGADGSGGGQGTTGGREEGEAGGFFKCLGSI